MFPKVTTDLLCRSKGQEEAEAAGRRGCPEHGKLEAQPEARLWEAPEPGGFRVRSRSRTAPLPSLHLLVWLVIPLANFVHTKSCGSTISVASTIPLVGTGWLLQPLLGRIKNRSRRPGFNQNIRPLRVCKEQTTPTHRPCSSSLTSQPPSPPGNPIGGEASSALLHQPCSFNSQPPRTRGEPSPALLSHREEAPLPRRKAPARGGPKRAD